jgi:hypothetical protein
MVRPQGTLVKPNNAHAGQDGYSVAAMTGLCPICDHRVGFLVAGANFTMPQTSWGWLVVEHWRCPECQAPFVRIKGNEQVLAEWPNAGSKPAPPGVPEAVASDWREAHVDLSVRTWKSAATMARRAVQGVCIDKGASKGRLADQIKESGANNTLHPNLVKWATEVRLFGNDGAHPGDDGLADVSEESARDAVAFLDELIDWIYVMPEKLASAKSRAGHPA